LEHLDQRLTTDGYLDHLEKRVVEMKQADSKDAVGERARWRTELERVQADIDAAFGLLGLSYWTASESAIIGFEAEQKWPRAWSPWPVFRKNSEKWCRCGVLRPRVSPILSRCTL